MLRISAILLSALFITSAELRGQDVPVEKSHNRRPVMLVLTDQLSDASTPFVVQHRGDAMPQEVLLLRSDANAQDLSEGVRTTIMLWQVGASATVPNGRFRMRPHQSQANEHRVFPWAARVLYDLRAGEYVETRDYGRVRVVTIWLPLQLRSSNKASQSAG